MRVRFALAACALLLGAVLLVATDGKAASFPTFPTQWTALSKPNGPVFDSSTDGPGSGGGPREIVGESSPAVYIASDGTYLFMRLRLDSTPLQSPGNYVSFGWGCEVNVYPNATNTYQWLFQIDGKNSQVDVEQNTSMATLDSPGSASTGPISQLAAFNGTSSGYSESVGVPNTDPNYNDAALDAFIDLAVPLSSLSGGGVPSSLSITTSTPIRLLCGSSSNSRNLSGDLAGTSASNPTISGNISISYLCGTNGCIACDTSSACGPSCGACSGSIPVCGGVTTGCVQCNTSSDCTSPNAPFCDASTHTCGPCTGDGPSGGCINPAKPACIASGSLAGTCQQCSATNSSQCSGSTPICNTTTDTCTGCTNNSQCSGSTPLCDANKGTCIPCNGDNGSGATEACPTSGNPYCSSTGACAKCASDADCTNGTHAGPFCNTSTGACGDACFTDAECGSGKWCDDLSGPGVCGPKVPNGQPVPGGTCTITIGGRACVSGVCDAHDNTCGYANGDGPCTASNGATVCRSNICATSGPNSGLCEPCASDANCGGSTPLCDPGTNKCVGCVSNANCSGATPLCNPVTHKCAACNGDGPSGGCPDPRKPACVTSGALAGTCQQCSATNATQCTGGTPTCDTSSDTCVPASGVDAGVEPSPDGGTPNREQTDDGSLEGGGCACTTESSRSTGALSLLCAAAAIAGLSARRRRRD